LFVNSGFPAEKTGTAATARPAARGFGVPPRTQEPQDPFKAARPAARGFGVPPRTQEPQDPFKAARPAARGFGVPPRTQEPQDPFKAARPAACGFGVPPRTQEPQDPFKAARSAACGFGVPSCCAALQGGAGSALKKVWEAAGQNKQFFGRNFCKDRKSSFVKADIHVVLEEFFL